MSFECEKKWLGPTEKETKITDFIKQLAELEHRAESPEILFDPSLLSEAVDFGVSDELAREIEKSDSQYARMASSIIENLPLRKKGILWNLGNKYGKFLEKPYSDEIRETIEKTLQVVAEHKNLGLGGLARQSLWKIMGCENDSKKAIDMISDYADMKIDSPYFWELGHFLKKDKTYSTQKLLEITAEGKIGENDFGAVMILLADIVGAENSRKKIDEAILASEENDEAQNNLCYARAFITPCEDKEAILNLKEFYQENIRFEEYKINEAMNEREVSLLKSLIGENDKTLEMGCGAGRLMKELAKEGHDVSGYDFTERHVEITKSEIEKSGSDAKVFQGDWHENAVKDESLDTVYSLGRNILHDYSIADQAQLFREASRILKDGGRFIFDIPDREKGGYAQMVKGYAEEMEKRGIRNFRFGSIYDSPDGTHFATRYAYSQEDIEELARMSGFKIADIKRLPLETGQGDENLYYVLEKI